MTNTTAGGGTLDSSEDMLHPTRWEPEWSRVFRIAHEDEQVDARELLHEIAVGAGRSYRLNRSSRLVGGLALSAPVTLLVVSELYAVFKARGGRERREGLEG